MEEEDIEEIVFAMDSPYVLRNFEGYARSYYAVCAAITVSLNGLLLLSLAARRIPGNSAKFTGVLIFSLALCDILYEIGTTVLLLRLDFCGLANNCKMLYFVYLALNLCTVFHIAVKLLKEALSGFGRGPNTSLTSSVAGSTAAWLFAFGLAYMDIKTQSGLLDGSAMVFLDRFKVFGYLLFAVVSCSGVLMTLLALTTQKSKEVSRTENAESGTREVACTGPYQENLVFSCLFMAMFVGWCAWMILGVDDRIIKTVEVMKGFEVIRVAARIMNLLTMLCCFSQHKTGVGQIVLPKSQMISVHDLVARTL